MYRKKMNALGLDYFKIDAADEIENNIWDNEDRYLVWTGKGTFYFENARNSFNTTLAQQPFGK